MPEMLFGIYGLAPFNILLLFVVVGFILQRKRESDGWRLPKRFKVSYFLMAILILVSAIRVYFDMGGMYEFYYALGTEPDPRSIQFLEMGVTTFKWMIPSFLVLAGCKDERRTQETIVVLTVVLTILALQIIRSVGVELLTDGDALQKRAARVLDRDIGYHRNQISLWMASGFWFVWLLFVEVKNSAAKFSLLAIMALTLFALILTGSRGGLMTWGICGFVFAAIRWRRLLVIGPIVAILVIAFVPALQERLLQGYSEEERTAFANSFSQNTDAGVEYASATAGRTLLWAACLPKIRESVLFGHGRESMVRTGVSQNLLETYNRSVAATHPHNMYLQALMDHGVVGLIIILYFFGLLTVRAAKMINSPELFQRLVGGISLAWLISYLASGITASTFYPGEGTVFLWCVIAILLRQGFPSDLSEKKLKSRGAVYETG